MQKLIYAILAVLCLTVLPASQGLALNCQPYWTEAYKRLQGCLGGGGGGGGAVYVPPPPPQPSPQELKQRQSTALNNQGSDQFRHGNYAEAIRLYERALALATTPETVRINRQNIANARSHLAKRAQENGNLEAALREIELAIQYDSDRKFDWPAWAQQLRDRIADQKNEAAAKRQLEAETGGLERVGRQIKGLEESQALSRAEAAKSSGLDFLPATAAPASGNAAIAKSNAAGGQSGLFGTPATPPNPDIGPAESGGKTTYSSASAQASAAAKDPGRVFDGRPGAASGVPLQFPTASSPAAKVDALAYHLAKSPQAMNDPLISTSLKWYLSLDAQVSEKQAQIAEVTKQLEAGKGDAQVLKARKESLEADVKRSKADQVVAEKQIKDQVKKLSISIDWQEAPPAAADASSQSAAGPSNAAPAR